MKLIRRWLATSAPIADMSPEAVSAYLQRAQRKGQFAVFPLQGSKTFAQFKRSENGGVLIEVSKRSPQVEALLATLGAVSISDDNFAFPMVISRAGDDDRVAHVIAQALSLLAVESGVPNVTRVRTGQG